VVRRINSTYFKEINESIAIIEGFSHFRLLERGT
jgi:hypothetical protein